MSDHSEMFEQIKRWYDEGKWKKKAVKNAVAKGWITAEEYEETVGEPFA